MLKKVVSGGQTGVDRAGLDAAMDAGIPVGGYCPKGRKAEDGTIPDHYPLTEMDTSSYTARKEKNVVESDGTLILNKGKLTSGTRKTYVFAVKHLKPCLIVQLDAEMMKEHSDVIRWIQEQQIGILNIAGSRESKFPEGIYGEAKPYLERLLVML